MPRVAVTVRRSDSDSISGSEERTRFEAFEVEVAERASILDVLLELQRGPAPDLAFRFSCRVGMCGSCAMVVNGREQLTCSTLVKSIGPSLRLEPLRNLPSIRDLVPDLSPLFNAYRKAMPHFVPRPGLETFAMLPPESAAAKTLLDQPQCIDCGSCYSACTLATLHPRYLGPMALHRAAILIADPRDGATSERMKIASAEDGAFRCRTLGNCGAACPRGISPTLSIQRIKRRAVFFQLRAVWNWLLGRKPKGVHGTAG
ncbi:MAG: succinate dehydrogenase/fumarate reductase iron-sulfur subunit [Verrucomicrobiota bacterium]